MKILKISGRNLASLAGDFCVDFEQEPLASSGLFAISGPTGAGKTTLLDALCLALYDATPRLTRSGRGSAVVPDVGSDLVSAQDARTLLRRGAAEAHAEVDFVGNDNHRYRARWSIRRSYKKASGALQASVMSLHRLPDLIALGGTKTEVAGEIIKRIGLTFEQFTRAVLLAQNEFSAFLKTDENDRGELLETLTGSSVYSALSRRAFERYKLEAQTMQKLSERLADHTPLSAEARCALDGEFAAAEAALALADARKMALEQQLRWHQEADKLREHEAQAEQTLLAARSAVDQAEARRAVLALRDTAEGARPLHAECLRLKREIALIEQAIAQARTGVQHAQEVQQAAAEAVDIAAAALSAAVNAQQAAQPRLDEAKALDAVLGSLAASHAQAAQKRDQAGLDKSKADQALAQHRASLHAATLAQAGAAQWLAANSQFELLSAQWPRWEALLQKASVSAAHARRGAEELLQAQANSARLQLAAQTAAAALAEKVGQLAAATNARDQAAAAIAAVDVDALRHQRDALTVRRDSLVEGDKLWTALAASKLRLQQLDLERSELAASSAQTRAQQEAASAAAPALAAALAQAERSLKAAQLACADSVEDLRASLEDGEPCPVCGSAEHPYTINTGLHDMLASLSAEVHRCRLQDQHNASTLAASRALLAGFDKQQAALTRERDMLQAQADSQQATWQASALATQADSTDPGAWLTAQIDALSLQSRALDADERVARTLTAARDTAQQAHERAAAAHAAVRDQSIAADAASEKAVASVTALAEKLAAAREQSARLLDELAPAFVGRSGWQDEWQANPERFASSRAAEAEQWRSRSAERVRLDTELLSLEAARAAAQVQLDLAARAAAESQATFAAADAELRRQQARRAALFDGRAVSDIERELGAMTDAARAALESRQAAAQEAAQAAARATESLAQQSLRLAHTRQQLTDAAQAFDDWLAAHRSAFGRDQLLALLQLDRGSLAAERSALHAIDAAAATAQAVLAERRQQRETHRQAAPPEDAGSAESIAAALAQLDGTRKQAMEAAAALRVQLAQDDVRRVNSQEMMARIEQQQQIELRWSRLNELIGSADGKKFRNYAQQFTLDVLLGYANSHLQELAKRYRLERIVSAGGPSLGLLVRDQDIGGEVRSVNSLSGGESFLVSLALALGLASLSSNRVRVESLFIDEGFGSLDSETLRVAMDALDGLQSMGRKVGVISHVQEMTERIATKVLVRPSGGGTSTVTVQ